MQRLRHHLQQHKWSAFMLVACVLFARVMIPSGFMPVATGQGFVIQLCTGMGPATMTIAIPGKAAPIEEQKGGKADSPCAFSGIAAPSLAGTDPVLLALALLFVMAMGLRNARPVALPYIHYLRPPLRGPPAHA